MKKLIYLVAVIAISFIAFAFKINNSIYYSNNPIQENSNLRIIELVTLNKNYNITDHFDYHKLIKPVMDKFGLITLNNFEVEKKFKGASADNVAMIGVYSVRSMEDMNKIFADKNYLQNVEKRDKIHDMTNMTLFLAKPVFEKAFDKSKTVLMDFVVMTDGFGAEERDNYFSKLEEFGKKHGLKRFASYEVIQFMGGKGPKDVTLVNFYEAGPETMKNLSGDSEYQTQMIPVRDKIFNMDELTVFMTKSISEKSH